MPWKQTYLLAVAVLCLVAVTRGKVVTVPASTSERVTSVDKISLNDIAIRCEVSMASSEIVNDSLASDLLDALRKHRDCGTQCSVDPQHVSHAFLILSRAKCEKAIPFLLEEAVNPRLPVFVGVEDTELGDIHKARPQFAALVRIGSKSAPLLVNAYIDLNARDSHFFTTNTCGLILYSLEEPALLGPSLLYTQSEINKENIRPSDKSRLGLLRDLKSKLLRRFE